MREMLDFLRIKNIEELFEDIPKEIRIGINLPEPKEEMEVEEEIRNILKKNKSFFDFPSFLPIIKPHYIPPAVEEIVGREEFYTSYTPYQAEASQGLLQALFEYQSVICELTGMDAANISMYDMASALGEACLMAERIKGKKKVIIPSNIFWHKKSVLKNYVKGAGIKIFERKFDSNGLFEIEGKDEIKDASAIYIENPNFFGIIDDRYKEIIEMKERSDALLIVGVDPLYLAIFNPPSFYGADIVIGNGYLGNHMNFGGPMLGIFACRKEYLRQMPGKIVGANDEGKISFSMTLQTREQHIRRGKATSNICSNEALLCISFLAYVAILGRNGLRKVAIKNMENAEYMAKNLEKIGFNLPFKRKFFNEFVAICPVNASHFNEKLFEKGIESGLIIDEYVKNGLLFGVTEMHSKKLIDECIEKMKEVIENDGKL